MYNTAKLPSTVILPSNKNVNYHYDGLNRLTSTSINTTNPITAQHTYMPTARGSSLYTTNLISTEVTNAFAYSYTYDRNGNITKIQNGTKQSDGSYTYGSTTGHWYTYDQYDQLTGDLNYDDATVTYYTYDTNGNITSKLVRDWNIDGNFPMGVLESKTFTYADNKGWGDLLTAYNGQTITYDAIGNPLTYRDGITMTWQNGRQLATLTNEDEGLEVSYTYDTSGLRTKKAVTGGITTKYVYEGGLLVRMSYGANIFDFNYDANGRPIGFKYTPAGSTSGSYYYYGVNSRGDIETLYNSSGTQIASYSYDAYGKPLSTTTLVSGYSTVISVQPLRYRSYVYDYETGLYYLQSRYYDPTTCRFINADVYYETGQGFNGYNMFAYCNNNPVMYSDPTGYHSKNTTCGSPTCTICRPERRDFINDNIDWYNEVTGNSIAGVTSTGDFVTIINSNKAPEPNSGYVYINDLRNKSDNPNIRVWNSYLITDEKEIESVVDVLLAYDKKYPAMYVWRYSKEAMVLEWQFHNDFIGTRWNDNALHADFDRNHETLFFAISSLQFCNGL